MAQTKIDVNSFNRRVRRLALNGQLSEPGATNLIAALIRAKAEAEKDTSMASRLLFPATIDTETAIGFVIQNAPTAPDREVLLSSLGVKVARSEPLVQLRHIDSLAISLPEMRSQLRAKNDEADRTMEERKRSQLFGELDQMFSRLKSGTEELIAHSTSSNAQLKGHAINAIKNDTDSLGTYLSALSNELDQMSKEAEKTKEQDRKHTLRVNFQHLEMFYKRILKQLELYAKIPNSQVALHAIKAIEQGKFDPEILYYHLIHHGHNEETKIQAHESLLNLFKEVADDSTPEWIKNSSLLQRVIFLTMYWHCPEFCNARATQAVGQFLVSDEAKKPFNGAKQHVKDYVDYLLDRLILALLFEMPHSAISEGTAGSERLLKCYVNVKDMLKSAALRDGRVADSLALALLAISSRDIYDISYKMLYHRNWELGLELMETVAHVSKYRESAIKTLEGLVPRIRSFQQSLPKDQLFKYDGPLVGEIAEREEAIAQIQEIITRLKVLQSR